MRKIHHHLCRKFLVYHRWHKHPLHPHVHWGVLGSVVLGVALSFVILGWSEVEVANVQAQGAVGCASGNVFCDDYNDSTTAPATKMVEQPGACVANSWVSNVGGRASQAFKSAIIKSPCPEVASLPIGGIRGYPAYDFNFPLPILATFWMYIDAPDYKTCCADRFSQGSYWEQSGGGTTVSRILTTHVQADGTQDFGHAQMTFRSTTVKPGIRRWNLQSVYIENKVMPAGSTKTFATLWSDDRIAVEGRIENAWRGGTFREAHFGMYADREAAGVAAGAGNFAVLNDDFQVFQVTNKAEAARIVGQLLRRGPVETVASGPSNPGKYTPECADGNDNDGDRQIDSADSQCASPDDNDESAAGVQTGISGGGGGGDTVCTPNTSCTTSQNCPGTCNSAGTLCTDIAGDNCPTTGANSPPRNLVLRYLGPTPTGGNLCGNPPGRIDPGEQCDGANLNGQTCQSLGFSGGTPACTAQCTFDTSSCTTPLSQCADGIDNADPEDTLIDMNDPGCSSASDNSEADPLPAGSINPPYPRTGLFQFSSDAPAEWYAKRDYVITASTNAGFARAIKNINPNTAIVASVVDVNTFSGNASQLPAEWIAKDSAGGDILIYNNSRKLIDISNLAPKTASRGNLRYNEWVADYVVGQTDLTAFDGVATHGMWEDPFGITDIDLDRNGQNDYQELGKGKTWVDQRWKEGVDLMIKRVRSQIGNKILHINSGRLHTFNWPETNGLTLEHAPGFNGIFANAYARQYDQWMAGARTPHVLMRDSIAKRVSNPADPNWQSGNPKNYFEHMRYGLGLAMYGDGYYSYTSLPRSQGEHHFDRYYDEFDVDLGYPIGPMRQVKQDVWARFFDLGAVILNFASSKTVTDAELRGVSGYAGPYYRFKGGQNPAFNNGQQFSSVSLYGAVEGNLNLGDATLLVKQPLTVIADIIIDNSDPATSPGSAAAVLGSSGSGNWTQLCAAGNWTVGRCDSGSQEYDVATAAGGSGITAKFFPTIGVEGRYEVYEWHGSLTSGTLASSVTHTITHTGGSTMRTVNQQTNAGQWNSLGTYRFNAGTQGNVTISASGANGTVMADAVMFRYVGL